MWSKHRPWHLHHQLIAVVSVLVVLAIGVLGTYTALQQGEMMLRGARTQAVTLARNMAISSSNPLLTDSLDVLEELARRSADFEDVQDIRILSAKGQTLTHVLRDPQGQVRLLYEDASKAIALPAQLSTTNESVVMAPSDSQLLVWYPILAGKVIGWVRMDYSTESVERLRIKTWTSTLLVAVAAIGVCGVLLVRFMNRPLAALRRATHFAVGLNDVAGQQLAVDQGSFEIASLGKALNEASWRLHQQMLSMQQQNECLGAIFSLSPDGLLTFDRMGRVEFANEAFLSLTGLAREQVEGASMAQLDEALQSLAAPDQTFQGVAQCFVDMGLYASPYRLDLLLAGGGRTLTFKGQHSESASVSGVLYVCDVTQQKRLDQMKSDFLSLAAHELRTPLTSIFGFTELLMMREMSPDRQKDIIRRVHGQTEVMMGILNELLDLARIEVKREKDLNCQSYDLADVATALVRSFEPPPDRQSPILKPSQARMPVRLDPDKFRQMVLNLLSNAYKYSPNGGEVNVYFVQDTDSATSRFGLAIEDHGLGLKPDQLARMGERFYRADKSGHIPGTGLGVSIVKELAELMGAQLTYSSEWQVGTTVTLWFEAQP